MKDSRKLLHCSHYITRSKLTTKYDPSNALAHCCKCHFELGGGRGSSGNCAEFNYNYLTYFTLTEHERVRLKAQEKFEDHQDWLGYISKHYRNEYAKMLDKRKNDPGIGRLRFLAWDHDHD